MLDFPNSPTVGTTYTGPNGIVWSFDGAKWANGVSAASAATPSDASPAMDGTAAAGASALYSRGDHVHPTDTSRYAAANPSGYQTAAQVTAAVPVASSTTPIMDGTATIGSGTTWAKADHVHPVDTSRYAATNPNGYVTAAGAATAAPVQSFNTRTGAITLTTADVTAVADATYVNVGGDTMTGTLNGTAATFSGTVTTASHVITNGFALTLQATAAGTTHLIQSTVAGQPRWQMQLGDNTAEAGSNAGSNFTIVGFSDGGSVINTAFQINRATGLARFGGYDGASTGAFIAMDGTPGQQRGITGTSNGQQRWNLLLGDATSEAGSDQGSAFRVNSYHDSGAYFASPLVIARNTSVATFSAAIVNGPSDGTLKENVAQIEGALDKVQALRGVRFNMIGSEREEIGLIAQDVAPVVPEIIQHFQTGNGEAKLALDYPKLTALLIEAVKELAARIDAQGSVT